jgi:hypothetical protein
MIQLKNLTKDTIDKIKSYRYDRIIEKHEGPEQWSSVIEYHNPDFIEIDKKPVLLPIDQEQHRNITILRTITDKEEKTITVFLKDTTYVEEPEDEWFMAGFVAICDKVLGEDFFIAILYHEWFIIDEHITDKK